MKLQKSKPLSKPTGILVNRAGSASSIAIILTSLVFSVVWLSVGGVGRVIVAIVASMLHGPICLGVGRCFSGRSEMLRSESLFSLGATIATTGVLNYLSLAMSGTFSSWMGFDAVSLIFVVVLTGLSFFTWFSAKKVLFH